jgi:hypothetical protein
LLGGPLGLHRFYLHGLGDMLGLGAAHSPSALGLYGVQRARALRAGRHLELGADSAAGLHMAGCALTAIIYGLMTPALERALQPHAPR